MIGHCPKEIPQSVRRPRRLTNGGPARETVQQPLVKTGGRLIKHARYYWLLLAESHLSAAAFREHAAENYDAAVASRIGGLQSTANFGDG